MGEKDEMAEPSWMRDVDDAVEQPRTMIIMCKRCGQATKHELTELAPGKSEARCLRCRELDAEASKIVEAQRRQQEIEARARAQLGGAPVQLPGASAPKRSTASIVVIVGGAIVALSAFLPWITVVNPFGGEMSKSGVEGNMSDGWFFVAIGVGLAISAATSPKSKGITIFWVVLALAAAGLGVLEMTSIQQHIDTIDSEIRHLASVGVGIYASIAGAVTALVGATMRGAGK
jgi:hypothetical protein